MIIRNPKELTAVYNPHGIEGKRLYDTEHAVIMHLLIKSGEALKLHTTPVDAAFYVLEGEPHITVGDECRQVGINDLIESPKDIPHSIANHSAGDVRVLVIKTPKPL